MNETQRKLVTESEAYSREVSRSVVTLMKGSLETSLQREAGANPGLDEYLVDVVITYKGQIKVDASSYEAALEATEEDVELKESPLFEPSANECWEIEVKAN